MLADGTYQQPSKIFFEEGIRNNDKRKKNVYVTFMKVRVTDVR